MKQSPPYDATRSMGAYFAGDDYSRPLRLRLRLPTEMEPNVRHYDLYSTTSPEEEILRIDLKIIEVPMPVATILIGLPGSGKTTFLKNQGEHLPNERFDDFHGSSLDGTGAFAQSRHYKALSEKLREGRDCIISDIEYCRPERITQKNQLMATISPTFSIQF